MWLAPLAQLLILAVAPAPSAPAATSLEPQYTRQTLFSIPFHIERPESIEQEPVEAQLFVSGDRGTRWDLYSKVEPTRQRFMFRAGGDGELWFAVRTLDRSGRLWPAGPAAPGLKVVVDTTPPKLQLDARRGDAGQVLVHWQVEELHPKLDSLSIQFRTGPQALWQSVAFGPQSVRSGPSTYAGDVSWMPPGSNGTLEIRAEFSDLAGNLAVSNAQVNLGSAAATAAPASAAAGTGQPWRSAATEPAPANWPATEAASPAAMAGAPLRSPAATPGNALKTTNPPPQVATVSQSNTPTPLPPALRDLPAGEHPRMVNSRVFELEYDVESVGPSGIARVELWGTRDGGRTWRSFAIDEHKRSPMVVNVGDEGLYGFRVVAQSGTGRGGRPPQSGDRPDLWIGVDLTKPTARITSVTQGNGTSADKVTIAWEAADDMLLAARPISLSYGPGPAGPWTLIAGGLENSGHHTWQVDSRVPPQVYLHVEVRDEAGNVGVYDTPDAVSIDHANPTARIRDVHALGQSLYRSPLR
ncbi:MAG: hypothetical protein ABSG68_11550 [Thermoguttaceae bacterium]|jgi:hypothetical protein